MASRKITPMINEGTFLGIRMVAMEHDFSQNLLAIDLDEATRVECDGFVSFVVKAIVSEGDRELILWCKVPPNNDARSLELFKRECLFYDEILSGFHHFQRTKGVTEESGGGFFATPKCYKARCIPGNISKLDAFILMEYKAAYEKWDWDKLEPLCVQHTTLLMEQLGRLHALSFAMKEQRPQLFKQWRKLTDVLVEQNGLVAMMRESFDRALTTMKTRFESEQEKILAVKDAVFESLQNCCYPTTTEEYCVVTHGDCWINNAIFSHDQDNTPTGVILTDWQSARYASPILDLGYFFFISAGEQFRREHMDDMLRHYHGALTDFLAKLGGDATRQFPFTTLMQLMTPFRELLSS